MLNYASYFLYIYRSQWKFEIRNRTKRRTKMEKLIWLFLFISFLLLPLQALWENSSVLNNENYCNE